MIKLFRNIRKKLIMENKTSKPASPSSRYFKYAIGEIVLVVIGILIALQINNWNEDRKEKAIVKSLLQNIRYDLIADTLAFSNRLDRIPFFIDNAKSLLNATFSDTLSANTLYNKLPYTVVNYKIKDQSFQKVLNTGITDFFEFNELFDDINTYYTINSSDFIQQTAWDSDNTIDDGKFWSAIGFEVDIYPDTFYKESDINFAQPENIRKAVFLEQLKTPDMRNTIKNNIYRKLRLNEALKEMKQRAKDIILKIDTQ